MTTAVAPTLTNVSARSRFRVWLIPGLIVLMALLVRWPFLGVEGVPGDLFLNGWWGDMSYKAGFEVYKLTEANHPPIFLILNGLSQAVAEIPFVRDFLESVHFTWTMRLKLWPVTAEILLILILWRWLRERGALRWLIPLVIALHPALILDSVMWGQSDPIFTLFLVVALLALNGGKVRLAWVLYALALLTKFQSIVLLPLLVVLTWRRCAWRQALTAPLAGVAVFCAVLAPYIIGSGWAFALAPYSRGSVDVFSFTTIFALNLWHVLEPGYWMGTIGGVAFEDHGVHWFPPLTDFQAGMLMLGVYTLVLCIGMWRHAHRAREFVWGAALYFGFFMLPTQIHERYLYPAVIMSLIGLAQERRLRLVVGTLVFTFTLNLLYAVNAPFGWLGSFLAYHFLRWTPLIALMQVMLFVEVTCLALFEHVRRWVLLPGRLALAGLVAWLLVLAVAPPIDHLPVGPELVEGLSLDGVAKLVGVQTTTRDDGMLVVNLFWYAQAPIIRDWRPRLELEREGQVVGTGEGSDQDFTEGSWRWFAGKVTFTTSYIAPSDGGPPDSLYLSMFEASSGKLAPLYQSEHPEAVTRVHLADFVDGELIVSPP